MKFLAFCLSLFLTIGPAFGQNTIGIPQIINYNNANYNGGTQNWDIQQDENGIMYFANNEGLVTFDGNHWKIYPIPNKTLIRSLYVASTDKIYVGAQDEFGFFSPDKNGSLQYHSLKSLIPKPQNQFADVWNVESFGESVFFRTTDRIFELKNNAIQVFPTTTEWRFLKQVGSRLIAQDKSQGLLQYKSGRWYPLNTQNAFEGILVTGVIQTGLDSFLISTLKNGLFVSCNGTVSPKKTAIDEELKMYQVYALAMINENEFVLGTTSDGCIIMNFKGEVVQKITHEEGLQNNNVLSLYLDNHQNLWAGLNNGISFTAYNAAIKYIRPEKTSDLATYSTKIFNQKLYVATSDGTYSVPLTGQNSDFSFSKGNFSQIKNSGGQVWRLDEVNNQLLMGYNDGAFVIRDEVAQPIMQGTGAWLFMPLSPVYPSRQVLAGTYIGLEMLSFNGTNFIDEGKVGNISESFRFLTIDNNNDIWTSHPYRGVYRFQRAEDGKTFTWQLFGEKDGLPSSLGNYVYKVKNHTVFATEKGVYEFDAASKRFYRSPFLRPVFDTMQVRYLTEDADGNIWFCSEKKMGVVSFDEKQPANFSITYFPELNGHILSGFENVYPYNRENIFIGSEKAIIHLNYKKYTNSRFPLSVLLGQVRAFDNANTMAFGGYYVQQDKAANTQLPSSYNSFHFEYSSPAFGLQNNIEYSYQLVGYDQGWSAWSAKTEKDYTNLSHGKYIFRVKARDNLGNESTITSCTFIVKAAWYNTVTAYIFYGFLLLLLVYLLYRWEKRKLYRQKIMYEEEEKRLRYIHQLELEKNEKEIIKLQNEKLANEVLFKNKELADATMHLVERSDALNKVRDELQKLYRNTSNNHDVKKVIQLLNDVEKNNENWDQFASHFDEVNNDFLKKLKAKYPQLSNTDLKVCAYLQLNLSTKEIAQLLNISVRGAEISRYRLRKKLQLSTDQTLNDFLNGI